MGIPLGLKDALIVIQNNNGNYNQWGSGPCGNYLIRLPGQLDT